MTELRFWYHNRSSEDKTAYRDHIIDACRVSIDTVYRYLDNQAPPLTAHLISDYTGIPTDKLYKAVKYGN